MKSFTAKLKYPKVKENAKKGVAGQKVRMREEVSFRGAPSLKTR